MKLSVVQCFIILSFSSWGVQAFQWRGYDCPAYEWKCGDICLPGQFTPDPICQCGNATFSTYSSLQCCIQPKDTCEKVPGSWPTMVNCSNGKVLDKTEVCHGSCYNDNSPYLKMGKMGSTLTQSAAWLWTNCAEELIGATQAVRTCVTKVWMKVGFVSENIRLNRFANRVS